MCVGSYRVREAFLTKLFLTDYRFLIFSFFVGERFECSNLLVRPSSYKIFLI